MDYGILGLMLFFGFSVALVTWVLLGSLREVQEDAEEQFEAYSTSPLFQLIVPFIQFFGRSIEGFQGSGFLNRFRSGIRKKLVTAGKSYAISPSEFCGFMAVCFCIGLGPQEP